MACPQIQNQPLQDNIFHGAARCEPLVPFLASQLRGKARCEMWDRHLEKRSAAEAPGEPTLGLEVTKLALVFYRDVLDHVGPSLPQVALSLICLQ